CVEPLHPHREVAARPRARVPHRPLDVELPAVGARGLLEIAPDREVDRGRGGERLFAERGGRRGRRRARRPRRGRAAREEERRSDEPSQVATSAAPAESTASPRSVIAVSTMRPGATCHMFVVMVSPGKTTPEKRTSNAFSRAGSLPQKARSTARPAWPKVQSPWRI